MIRRRLRRPAWERIWVFVQVSFALAGMFGFGVYVAYLFRV
jgi:hypothetical protein